MKNTVLNAFMDAFLADKKYVKDWLVTWDYQKKRARRKIVDKTGGVEDINAYNGPQDLVKWFEWISKGVYPDYFPKETIDKLKELSYTLDYKILNLFALDYDSETYNKTIGRYNAQDYLIPNFYPVPEKYRIRNILDFGAGYGRQANLWTQKHKDIVYVGMDAIPNSYALQNFYYSNLGVNFTDYVDAPKTFKLDLNENGIYHIPTWRYDLLPSSSFDLITCVQVLPELNTKLVSKILLEFHRILKPGGLLYIRDHDQKWQPAGKINVNNYLQTKGFSLEFRPHIINEVDLHGIPRLFRKIDLEVVKSQTMTFQSKVKQGIDDMDSFLGGLLGVLKRKVSKKKKKA